jgi:hypothetical protein
MGRVMSEIKMAVRRYSSLDILVVLVFVLSFIGMAIHILCYDKQAGMEFREQPLLVYWVDGLGQIFIPTVGVAALLTWIVYGGADSRLWYWLPPFCGFFYLNRWQKKTLVVLLVLMIVAGIAGGTLGFGIM